MLCSQKCQNKHNATLTERQRIQAKCEKKLCMRKINASKNDRTID